MVFLSISPYFTCTRCLFHNPSVLSSSTVIKFIAWDVQCYWFQYRSFQIEIESINAEGLNTVIVVNADGNPFEGKGEVCHWMVANIPDGKEIEEGEEVLPWMQVR